MIALYATPSSTTDIAQKIGLTKTIFHKIKKMSTIIYKLYEI